jgi:hypothetical protein
VPVLVIETAPGVVAQAVMHVVLLVRKVVQVVPEQECEVGEVVRHKMSQEWHKAVVTVGRVDVLPGWLAWWWQRRRDGLGTGALSPPWFVPAKLPGRSGAGARQRGCYLGKRQLWRGGTTRCA